MIHLDTHVLSWLYAGDLVRFPVSVQRRIDRSTLVISPMVELELQYLFEVGRARRPGREVVADLMGRLGLVRSRASFFEVVERAQDLAWTRDPFDRLIVAAAMADRAPLLTRDEHIRGHFPDAIWADSAESSA